MKQSTQLSDDIPISARVADACSMLVAAIGGLVCLTKIAIAEAPHPAGSLVLEPRREGEAVAIFVPADNWLDKQAQLRAPQASNSLLERIFHPNVDPLDSDFIGEAAGEYYQAPGDAGQKVVTSKIEIPRLEGGLRRMFALDGSVPLRFDRPIGRIKAVSPLPVDIESDDSHQFFRLLAKSYPQGQTYPLQLLWTAPTGEPLPPMTLELITPPPINVSTNTQGITNIGLALPLQLTFSEPLAERSNVKELVSIKTADGQSVSGSWAWAGKRQLQFRPRPAWPASSTINVRVDNSSLRAEQGGRMEEPFISSFNTGTDRRIIVYLDSQTANAIENGQLVRTFKVSTGKAKTPTETGNFYIYDRYLRKTMKSRGVPKGHPGYYLVEDVPYTQFFNGDLALHGAFWHNGFGRPASHGCVNLSTRTKNKRWPNVAEDAGWLYNWASLGVPVTVTVTKDTPVEMAKK